MPAKTVTVSGRKHSLRMKVTGSVIHYGCNFCPEWFGGRGGAETPQQLRQYAKGRFEEHVAGDNPMRLRVRETRKKKPRTS